MHLVSRCEQTVTVAGRQITFAEGESIHTENSYKHRPETLMDLARSAGWESRKVWKDHAGLFGVILLRGG